MTAYTAGKNARNEVEYAPGLQLNAKFTGEDLQAFILFTALSGGRGLSWAMHAYI